MITLAFLFFFSASTRTVTVVVCGIRKKKKKLTFVFTPFNRDEGSFLKVDRSFFGSTLPAQGVIFSIDRCPWLIRCESCPPLIWRCRKGGRYKSLIDMLSKTIHSHLALLYCYRVEYTPYVHRTQISTTNLTTKPIPNLLIVLPS